MKQDNLSLSKITSDFGAWTTKPPVVSRDSQTHTAGHGQIVCVKSTPVGQGIFTMPKRDNPVLRVFLVFTILLLLVPNVSALGEGWITGVANYFNTALNNLTHKIIQGFGDLIKLNPQTYPPKAGVVSKLTGTVLKILIPFYEILLLVTGIYIILMSSSPQSRERAKGRFKLLLVGMMITSVSPMIYQMLLDVEASLVETLMVMADNVVSTKFGTSVVFVLIPAIAISSYFITVAAPFIIFLLLAVFGIIGLRYIVVSMFAIFFPITMFLYFFDWTKPVGFKMLRWTFIWIFVPVVQAVLFLVLVVEWGQGTGIAGWLMGLGAFALMGIAPLMMTTLLAVMGGAVTHMGMVSNNARMVLLGRVMMGWGPHAIEAAGAYSAISGASPYSSEARRMRKIQAEYGESRKQLDTWPRPPPTGKGLVGLIRGTQRGGLREGLKQMVFGIPGSITAPGYAEWERAMGRGVAGKVFGGAYVIAKEGVRRWTTDIYRPLGFSMINLTRQLIPDFIADPLRRYGAAIAGLRWNEKTRQWEARSLPLQFADAFLTRKAWIERADKIMKHPFRWGLGIGFGIAALTPVGFGAGMSIVGIGAGVGAAVQLSRRWAALDNRIENTERKLRKTELEIYARRQQDHTADVSALERQRDKSKAHLTKLKQAKQRWEDRRVGTIDRELRSIRRKERTNIRELNQRETPAFQAEVDNLDRRIHQLEGEVEDQKHHVLHPLQAEADALQQKISDGTATRADVKRKLELDREIKEAQRELQPREDELEKLRIRREHATRHREVFGLDRPELKGRKKKLMDEKYGVYSDKKRRIQAERDDIAEDRRVLGTASPQTREALGLDDDIAELGRRRDLLDAHDAVIADIKSRVRKGRRNAAGDINEFGDEDIKILQEMEAEARAKRETVLADAIHAVLTDPTIQAARAGVQEELNVAKDARTATVNTFVAGIETDMATLGAHDPSLVKYNVTGKKLDDVEAADIAAQPSRTPELDRMRDEVGTLEGEIGRLTADNRTREDMLRYGAPDPTAPGGRRPLTPDEARQLQGEISGSTSLINAHKSRQKTLGDRYLRIYQPPGATTPTGRPMSVADIRERIKKLGERKKEVEGWK